MLSRRSPTEVPDLESPSIRVDSLTRHMKKRVITELPPGTVQAQIRALELTCPKTEIDKTDAAHWRAVLGRGRIVLTAAVLFFGIGVASLQRQPGESEAGHHAAATSRTIIELIQSQRLVTGRGLVPDRRSDMRRNS